MDWNKWNDMAVTNAKLRDIVNDKLITIGFAQINYQNTHRGTNEESNIDHIWINCPRRVVNHDIIHNLNSDHEALLAQIRDKDLNIREDRRVSIKVEEL